MQTSGVITITTDFGHKGPFTGVMKGVILGRFPTAKIVDLNHDIPAQWPPEAGFWVARSYRYFPPGSVHLAIVDPGVGTEREILIVEYDGHCFMAPDNGLLGPLLADADNARVYHLDTDVVGRLGVEAPSSTFHGRDIFAPVAAEIASGRLGAETLGKLTADWVPAWLDPPTVGHGRVTGIIVTVDTFGNLISDIDASMITSFAEPLAHIAGHRIGMRTTYGRAKPGDYLALINSFGVVEVARAEGSAAEGLSSDRGAPITVTDGHSATTST